MSWSGDAGGEKALTGKGKGAVIALPRKKDDLLSFSKIGLRKQVLKEKGTLLSGEGRNRKTCLVLLVVVVQKREGREKRERNRTARKGEEEKKKKGATTQVGGR